MVKWKREKVQDHKFDFVDVQEFEKQDFYSRIRYSYVFFIVLKSVLVYLGDLYIAGGLILSDLGDKWGGIHPLIPFKISRWVYVGIIVISYILLFIEVRKAKRIIASGDISYAFTSTIATRYYTLTSYAHWCFFQEIINQQRTRDKTAFFVFFTFKGWKRLIFCDGPRQVINALLLYAIVKEKSFTIKLSAYGSLYRQANMAVIIFTVTVFIVSACLLLIAFILYIPLLCIYIKGNLKEYCCHMIDKRIGKLLSIQKDKRKKNGQNLKGPKHLDGKTPTLPNIDDDLLIQEQYPPMPQQMHPHHDITPMAFNNYSGIPSPTEPYVDPYVMPNVPRNNAPPQGMYNYQRRGSISSSEGVGGFNNNPYIGVSSDLSQGVIPIYNANGQFIETDQLPPRPDSNNSNSAYSDTSTKYSGQGRYQYPPQQQFPPQHQYPYRKMPQGGFNNVDPYGQQIPYQNIPQPKQHDEYYDGSNYNQDIQFAPLESARQQTTSAIPPSQRNNIRYQQNRPYNNYH